MKAKIDDRIKEEYETKMKGTFKIYLGDELYAKGKNKWTRYFASSIVEFVVSRSACETYSEPHTAGLSRTYTARAGNDTSTPTSPDMADLVSKIDINPDAANRVIFKSDDYTKYRVRFKFSWNPGTIPAQIIGEFGVYLYLTDDSWSSPAENPSFRSMIRDPSYAYDIIPIGGGATRLASRIASADGDFDPIYYDSSEALILEWYVTIKF